MYHLQIKADKRSLYTIAHNVLHANNKKWQYIVWGGLTNANE